MELFRCRVRTCLLVAVALLLIEPEMAKADDQLEGNSGDSLPEEPAAGGVASRTARGRPQRSHQPKSQHDHDHDRQHDHRQPQRGTHTSFHRRQQAKHQSASGPKAIPPTLSQHSLSRSEDVDAHDLLDCQPQPGDRLLARSVVRAEFRPLGFAEASWFFPQNGRDQNTVHCVRVLDQRRDGYGGYPRIVRGGVGHHYVELSFKSDFSRGFHFVVEVYGK